MAKIALAIGIGVGFGLLGAFTFGLGTLAAMQLGVAGLGVGQLLGNLIMPTKLPNQYGPRINELTVSTATNGQPIPIGYGTFRLAAAIIWSPGIVEHSKTTKKSAKGMGGSYSSTSYTYTCSFAASFGESYGKTVGTRFGDVLKIWFDSKVVFDKTTGPNNSKYAAPVVYNGTETQNPDPTIQAKQGVPSTPAHRGLIYAVWTDFLLSDFGNRLPNVQALVQFGQFQQTALADIITDLAIRAGLSQSQVDTSRV